MIIQGSNNPLVIQFDASVENMPVLVVTLWADTSECSPQIVKQWNKEDMIIDQDTAVCPMTEAETNDITVKFVILEAKGLDGDGNTIFWDQYKLDIKKRYDRVIPLTQEPQESTELEG